MADFVDIDATTAMESLTLHCRLTGVKRLMVRVIVGKAMLKIAAYVLGCSIMFEDNASYETIIRHLASGGWWGAVDYLRRKGYG